MKPDIYELTNNDIVRELGKRFKEYRLNYAKTQKEIAEYSGLSMATVSNFENGSATGITLNGFIRLLRVIHELDQIDNLLTEQPVSPFLLLKQQKKKRKRVKPGKNGE